MLKFFQFFPVFIVFLQFYYMHQIHITSNMGNFPITLVTIPFYLVTFVSVFILATLCFNVFVKPWLRLFTSCFLIVFFNVLISYHFASRQQFEWSFFADNIGIIFSLDSLYTIVYSLDWGTLAYAPVIILIMIGFDRRNKWISYPKYVFSRRSVFILFFVYLLIIIMPIRSQDPFVSLFRSILYYFNSPIQSDVEVVTLNKTLLSNNISSSDKPHVFLIVIESMNGNYAELKDYQNKPVTPFLNELKTKSLSIDYFYGNSVQTAKGHAAIFLSAMPSLRGKLFTSFDNLYLDSIFHYLKRQNYRSFLYLANRNVNYDNTKPFLQAKGLDDMVSVYDFISEEDKNYYSTRWGLYEEAFVRSFFDYYDEYTGLHQQPIFSVLITNQSHFPFILPKQLREAFPNASTLEEHYANCLKNIDKGISLFYRELESRGLSNSIVIVTGDHAFPMGAQGVSSLEAGYYEESYRIPFFMTGPNIPHKVLKGPYSQLDIAPTLLDLLNISVSGSTFMGQSIFDQDNDLFSIQIQPYEKQIGVVTFPLKYRYSIKTNTEYLYDLKKDPLETKNIISTLKGSELDAFRSKVKTVYSIQKFYESQL